MSQVRTPLHGDTKVLWPRFLLTIALLSLTSILLSPPSWAQQADSEAARDSVDVALQLAQEGKLDEAISYLEQQGAAATLPDPVVGLLGALYLDAGQADKAYGILKPLANRADARPMVLVSASRAAFARGEVGEAEGWMQRAADMAPDSDAARSFALHLTRQGRFAEATEIFERYSDAHPEDESASLALAMAALKAGAPEQASRALDRVASDNPGARLLRGELALQQNEPRRARQLLESIWDSHPEGLDLDLRRLLAEACLLTGDPSRAISILRGFETEQPGMAIQLSVALYQSGEVQAAADSLSRWVDLLPQVGSGAPPGQVAIAVGVATEWGRAMVALDRADEAEEVLLAATRLMPNTAETWNVLGHALIAQNKMDAAREAVGRFHSLQDGPPVE